MRQIKFRGYSKEIGRWFYGDLFTAPDNRYFIRMWDKKTLAFIDILVEKESIGQLINLKDKNSKEIFEGDIVKFTGDAIELVEFKEGCFIVRDYDVISRYNKRSEVIGNIFENPELLEEK